MRAQRRKTRSRQTQPILDTIPRCYWLPINVEFPLVPTIVSCIPKVTFMFMHELKTVYYAMYTKLSVYYVITSDRR